jgi:tRNA (guanine-N7-)-methyltransferase
VEEAVKSRKRRKTNKARFRQHVNPLARHYQQPCALPDNWPQSVFKDAELPLHVDIGCGKGGFLMELAAAAPKEESESDAGFYRGRLRNYLGLEIRPLVAQHALEKLAMLRQQQMQQHQHSSSDNDSWTDRVHFVGCNVNVDLDRVLGLYGGDPTTSSSNMTPLEMVTLQFPDPHFKSYHAKRRVVNADLVRVLARHLAPGTGQVFLQSDVQSVLDDMRQQFAAHPAYFADQGVGHSDGYYPHNVFDIPTEREVSVLEKGLPVYRALFVRTAVPCESMDPADPEEQ